MNASLVSEAELDVALSRILTQRFRVGSFDPAVDNPYRSIPPSVLDSPAHRQVALEAAHQAVTVLENNHNTLPLPKSPTLSVAVIGPMADNAAEMKGGKDDYQPSFITTILEGVTAKVASFAAPQVAYAAGSTVSASLPGGIAEATRLAGEADVTLICLGIDGTSHERPSREGRAAQPSTHHDHAFRPAAASSQHRA